MVTNKSVIVGGDVQGNITSCKIENQLLSTHRNSAFVPHLSNKSELKKEEDK